MKMIVIVHDKEKVYFDRWNYLLIHYGKNFVLILKVFHNKAEYMSWLQKYFFIFCFVNIFWLSLSIFIHM